VTGIEEEGQLREEEARKRKPVASADVPIPASGARSNSA
jgi:hypothetical protein